MFPRTFQRPRLQTVCVLILAVGLSLPTPGVAQFGHFFTHAKMTADDIDLASKPAETLYTKSGGQAGDQPQWRNPETDHNGVIDVREVEDGPCFTLRHIASTVAHGDIRYYVRRCKEANGNWVLCLK